MADLETFRKTITAPTPFKSLVDLIPATEKVCMYADELSTKNRKPLKYPQLQSFIKDMDLRKYGIGRDDTVCTAMPNGSEAATCFWALADQCVFAPLNPALTVAEIEFELLDLPCHTMIMMKEPEKYYANAPSSAIIEESCKKFNVQVLWLTPDPNTVGLFTLSGGDSSRKAADKDECAAEHLALVLHTSGTTKKPKIVPLTHSNLAHGIQFVAATLRRQQTDLNLNVMPLFHIHGLIANVGVSTYSAAPFVASSFFGGADFCDKLDVKGKVPTWYSAVPTMHEAILLEGEKRGKEGLKHSLTLMRNCSAALLPPVSKRFLKAFGTELGQPFTVVPTYAMTESFPICSNPPGPGLEVKLSTVGPAMGPNIKILNGHPDDTEVANVGDEGEVCVKGQCVTAGYLMREHMSADPNIEAYTTKDSSVGKMLRTGDKGYCDAEGYMQLVGRFKEIINCGGEKISPLEMEDQLLTNVPTIETCVCFASPADMLGEIVGVACVTKEGSAYPTLEQVRDGLPQTMSRFKPRVLVIMDAIPKGPTGKPKRIGLAQMLKIPAIEVGADAVYRVEGKGDGIKPTQRLAALWGAEVATLSPVLEFPLTISLHVSPDLGDYHRTEHTLVIEDSLCNEFKLEITTFAAGCPVPTEFPITREEVFEALNYTRDRLHEYGMDWTAKIGENGRYEDWCSTLTVTDPHKTMVHQWDLGCSDTPPGKLIRLLKLLDCGHGTEAPPDYDPTKEPPPPNWPGPKGDGVPVS